MCPYEHLHLGYRALFLRNSLEELILGRTSHFDAFSGYSKIRSYSALRLASQPIHHWYLFPGPLVLRKVSFNSSAPVEDRDRTVSRTKALAYASAWTMSSSCFVFRTQESAYCAVSHTRPHLGWLTQSLYRDVVNLKFLQHSANGLCRMLPFFRVIKSSYLIH